MEEDKSIDYRYVDGERGIKIVCEGVSCVFEFIPYQFHGEKKSVAKAPIDESHVVIARVSEGKIDTEVCKVPGYVGGVSPNVGGVAAAVGGVAAAVGGVAEAMGEVKPALDSGKAVGGFMPVVKEAMTPVLQDDALQDEAAGDNVTTNQQALSQPDPNITNSSGFTAPGHMPSNDGIHPVARQGLGGTGEKVAKGRGKLVKTGTSNRVDCILDQ